MRQDKVRRIDVMPHILTRRRARLSRCVRARSGIRVLSIMSWMTQRLPE